MTHQLDLAKVTTDIELKVDNKMNRLKNFSPGPLEVNRSKIRPISSEKKKTIFFTVEQGFTIEIHTKSDQAK